MSRYASEKRAIQNKIEPGDPLESDVFHLAPQEAAKYRHTLPTLFDALDALEADHDFLLQGNVFTTDLLEVYIAYKRENEVAPLR